MPQNAYAGRRSAYMDGMIFDIKEGAVHDGPGLRQTVFLKGCPLRCAWCHNPEGLFMYPELMVAQNGCTHCGLCRQVCQHPGACSACGACVSACPRRMRRVVGERLSPEALVARLMENAGYYASVGGGVTFSGGEPLMQPDFLLETLQLLGQPIHKALETSGYAPPGVFEACCQAVDLVMLDLKHMDDAAHCHYTGVSNRPILHNLQTLCQGETPFIIRIPVIPGVNDQGDHFPQVAQAIAQAPALLGVELLPYHLTAGAKYPMLGKVYAPSFQVDQPIVIDQRPFEAYGIRSCVL